MNLRTTTDCSKIEARCGNDQDPFRDCSNKSISMDSQITYVLQTVQKWSPMFHTYRSAKWQKGALIITGYVHTSSSVCSLTFQQLSPRQCIDIQIELKNFHHLLCKGELYIMSLIRLSADMRCSHRNFVINNVLNCSPFILKETSYILKFFHFCKKANTASRVATFFYTRDNCY